MQKIYGKNAVKEAIKSGHLIENVYLEEGIDKKERNLLDMIKERNIPFSFIKKSEMDKMFPGLNQGIGASVSDYQYYDINEVLDKTKKQYFLILDGLEDPQNLGAILRTADATSFDCVIIPKNRSVSLNATVAKVSVGAIEYVKMIQVNNLNQTIDLLKSNGFWIVGTDMNGSKDYTEIDTSTSLAIIIGSEGFGMSRLVREKCDYCVSIKMTGHVNSLNASVSAGLLMYEVFRKKE